MPPASDPRQRDELETHYAAWKRGQVGVRLAKWNTALVSGADAASFLQKFCTNDLARLEPGQGCESFFTDVKGKIVAHGAILRAGSQWRLLLPAGNVEPLVAHLDRFVIREDVTFSIPAKQTTRLLSVQSTTDLWGMQAENSDHSDQDGWDHVTLPDEHNGGGGFVVRCEEFEADAVCVFGPKQINHQIASREIATGNDDLAETLRIEAAWPLWGVDFDATNLPQEVNRDKQAISFHKGCYLGQETVARLDALGHVNRQLRRVQFAGDWAPPAGTPLHRGEELVGTATSSCWSPEHAAPLVWAMLRRTALAVGTELTVSTDSAADAARVGRIIS